MITIEYMRRKQKQIEEKMRLEAELEAEKEAERVAKIEAELREQEEIAARARRHAWRSGSGSFRP